VDESRAILERSEPEYEWHVTQEDAVKVLDFGLAKAIEGDPSSIEIANSPTMSRMATMQGVLLGTAAYMSPEQAKGKSVDRRADIWAFGGVLYEMLTGKMAFTGETVTDTLAAVIMKEPDGSQLPAATRRFDRPAATTRLQWSEAPAGILPSRLGVFQRTDKAQSGEPREVTVSCM
jgi:eukaryotic-like serine/threonine-protein kinase